MPPTFDPSGDYAIFDGIETVTLTSRTTNAAGTTSTSTTSIAGAFREAVTAANAFFIGAGFGVSDDATIFHLPADEMAGAVPKRADTITDSAGVVWTIQNLDYNTLITNWRCGCTKLVT